METNGVELGEMDRLLLEKIEELTLYVIQPNKTIQRLDAENKMMSSLKKEIETIKQNMKVYGKK